MKQYLLFDLDGTLTDPKIGITTCVQYALQSFGIDEPDLDKLESFIGPPLRDSFMNFYGLTKEQAEEAVTKYRERFQDVGIFENRVYEGIPEMLRMLQSKGMYLAVASSKPEVYVKRILEHYKLLKYFVVVVGSELDGTREKKQEVIEEAVRRLSGDNEIPTDNIYMIGDRLHDVEGAKANNIESVAVTYGYGSMEELREAKADYIVRSVEELQKFLLRGTETAAKPKKKTFMQNLWPILYAFLMFLLVRQIVGNLLSMALHSIGGMLPGIFSGVLLIYDEAGQVIEFTGNAMTIISALAFLASAYVLRKNAKTLISWAEEDTKLAHLKKEPTKNYIFMFTAAVSIVIGINLLFELTQFTDKSEAYQMVVEDQYSATFLVGIICFGLITPFAEEILFRGIIYNAMKRFMAVKFAIILSAFVFGTYHGNTIQGTLAFVMGCLMAYGYEYFGNFMVPIAIHMISNVLSYSLSYTALAVSGFISWPVCVLFLAIGAGSVVMLAREKKVI